MAVGGRGKLEYLTGEAKKPSDPSSSAMKKWETENFLVSSWLINAMTPQLQCTFMYLPSAHEIWEAVRHSYSDAGDHAHVFDLQRQTWQLKQGNMDVTEYWHKLMALWQELDLYTDNKWDTAADIAKNQQNINTNRVFVFLAGLNSEFDDVRSRILSRPSLPTPREVFSEVRREVSRRIVMMPVQSPASLSLSPGDSTAMVSKSQNSGSSSQKGRPFCDFCKKTGHTRDKCWDLHGKPADWKSKKNKSRGYHAQSDPSSATSGPTTDQMSQLIALLKNMQSDQVQPPPTATIAHKGIPSSALNMFRPSKWIVDTGASDHMTSEAQFFDSYRPSAGNERIRTATGSGASIAGTGTVKISDSLKLNSVLHIPNLACNLLSVSKLTQAANCTAHFSATHCVFQDLSSGKMIGTAEECDGLYYLNGSTVKALCSRINASVFDFKDNNVLLWHKRMGHPSISYLKQLFPHVSFNKDTSFSCETCEIAKHHRTTFSPSSYKPTRPFSLIHSDVWGPMRIPNRLNAKFFVTFIDDHTRMCWVYLLKEKSEVPNIFIEFFTYVKSQFHAQIQVLHSDNGLEYFNHHLDSFLKSHGIVHNSSCPNSPQQNGVAERKNRHLLEISRALLHTTNVPNFFWSDAILTATHLVNRLPSRILSFISPLEKLRETYPVNHLDHHLPLRVFGCSAFVHVHHPSSKLDPRAVKCIFLGYSNTQKGYKCYSPLSKQFFVSRDVTFHEQHPYYTRPSIQGENWDEFQPSNITSLPTPIPPLIESEPVTSIRDSNEPTPPINPTQLQDDLSNMPKMGEAEKLLHKTYSRGPRGIFKPATLEAGPTSKPVEDSEQVSSSKDDSLPIALRKEPRTCTNHPIQKFVSYTTLLKSHYNLVTSLDKMQIPNDVYEALEIPEWKDAVITEIRALEKNDTWDIVDLPKGTKIVGCKWIFNPKYNPDGTLNKYKARLVARGFTQTHGIDYNETFAPVAKLNTVRVLLSIAANLDWPLQQLDIKNAFLNGELKEDVYMALPPGFDKDKKGKVCKLKKSLYGLKQSPRAWFERFSTVLKTEGYKQSLSDHTMFVLQKGELITILIVYVDDIILTGNDSTEIDRIKAALNKEFEVKDLGKLRYFLGMEVARSKEGISVSQRKYILDLLKETGMLGCKPSKVPISVKKKKGTEKSISPEKEIERRKKQEQDELPADKGQYQRLVGRLIYLSHTRPDIAFAVSVASQHMHTPKKKHMDAAFKILRYLKGTPGRGLFFRKNDIRTIEIYTDADWAGSTEDSRSTSGYCTFVWGNLVTWQSQKQRVVSKSSAESELRALSQGVMEGIWLKRVTDEANVQVDSPIKLYCDNKAALSMALNPVQHSRTKHVEVDRHFIREKVEDHSICLSYVPTRIQLADILTKGLPEDSFEAFVRKLGMISIYAPT